MRELIWGLKPRNREDLAVSKDSMQAPPAGVPLLADVASTAADIHEIRMPGGETGQRRAVQAGSR
jgi:hypothetical protein